ncbi:hypothetical protein GCM10010177_01040 [Actinomadura citrea]|nr:hypothetical protein GCM10010177_01040 [Actinomadura citrea]
MFWTPVQTTVQPPPQRKTTPQIRVVYTPLVLGPDHVPLMKDGSQVAADPAMGVLSALFHGRCER